MGGWVDGWMGSGVFVGVEICDVVFVDEGDLNGVEGLCMEGSVLEVEEAGSVALEVLVVRDHDACDRGFLVDLEEEVHDGGGVCRVEVTGRLVKKKNLWRVCQRTGDGDTLLLSARELRGEVVEPVTQADPGEEHDGPLPPLRLGQLSQERHGELDVFVGRHGGEEVERLEHKPDLLQPEL